MSSLVNGYLSYADISLLSEVTDVSDTSIQNADHNDSSPIKLKIRSGINPYYEHSNFPPKQVRFNPAVAIAASVNSNTSVPCMTKPPLPKPPSLQASNQFRPFTSSLTEKNELDLSDSNLSDSTSDYQEAFKPTLQQDNSDLSEDDSSVSWTYSDVTPRPPEIKVYDQRKLPIDKRKNSDLNQVPSDLAESLISDVSCEDEDSDPTCRADVLCEEHGFNNPRVHSTKKILDRMEEMTQKMSCLSHSDMAGVSQTALRSAQRKIHEDMSYKQRVSERVAEAVNIEDEILHQELAPLDISDGSIVRETQRKAYIAEKKALQRSKQTKSKINLPKPDPMEYFNPREHINDCPDFTMHNLPKLLPELTIVPSEIDMQLYHQYREQTSLNW